MSDYCYCGRTDAACGEEPTKTVRLKFLREQLLYDIRNYAFVEADVMGEDQQHAQHVTADIGEDGNVDSVTRILAVVHAAVIELLYPWTKQQPVEEEIDDRLFAPDEYLIEVHVPESVSRTTLHLLSRLIHEYMVYRVLADWLAITNPAASQEWAKKAEATEAEINSVKHTRRKAFVRKSHPW